MHLTSKQATEQYKVSIRTLRSLISSLTAEQKQMHLLIKGKQHLISTELLNQHYQARTGEQVQSKGAKVQSKGAKQVQSDRAATDAPPTDTATDAKQMQNETAKVQKELIAHLTNEVAQLHSRLQESTYIIANLTKQLPAAAAPTDTPGPKPNTTTDTPFILFVVGFCLGLFAIGLVIWILY